MAREQEQNPQENPQNPGQQPQANPKEDDVEKGTGTDKPETEQPSEEGDQQKH